jgi:hypothetical protein
VLKTYSFTPKQKAYEAFSAYARGDMEAGRIVDGVVRERMERTGCDYSSTLKELRREYREAETADTCAGTDQVTVAERHAAGAELDMIAKDFMLHEGLGYSAALKKACLGNPTMATKYIGKPVRGDGFAEAYGVATADKTLSNVVAGAPRLSNGRIDWAAAVNAAAQYPDLCQAAAREKIEHLSREWIRINGLSGNPEDHLPGAMSAIRREYPALSAMANDGRNVSEEALRDVYPQYK